MSGTTVDISKPDQAQITHLLEHGVEQVEVRADLEQQLQSGRQLRVKMGFDPSAPDIHLGHYVGLRKLREFQELGHKVVIIVGDWTARIGDPSGRSAQRKMLTEDEVNRNAQTYLDQFFNVVDSSPEVAEIRPQSAWFGDFDLTDVLRLASKFTVAQMLARDDFSKRYSSGSPIAVVELLYPLMQAYDSVAVESDVEMGGTDQTFNLLVGRDIQRESGQRPQNILTVPILVGTDGSQKMSKSLGNYVGITDAPDDMFGKLMSIPDSAIPNYLELVTSFSEAKVTAMMASIANGTNPRDIKEEMALDVVSTFHGKEKAESAKSNFDSVFRSREIPDDIPEMVIALPHPIIALLRAVDFASSNAEARRLIDQGGVRIDGIPVSDASAEIDSQQPFVLQAGKRRFVRIHPQSAMEL